MKKLTIVCFLSITGFITYAQNKAVWNNKKCAVALTYDDALNVHIDNAVPVLDSLGLKATFYLSGLSGVLNNRLEEWRILAKNGHELGNHTLFHPCAGNRPGREFVKPEYDLSNYSFRRIQDEIRMTNTVLRAIDGKKERTFAYPCGDIAIGDSFYLAPLHNEFVAARGVNAKMSRIQKIDLYNMDCYAINGQSGDELITLVKNAMASNSLLVFLFHGVGGEHNLNVTLPAHRQLLKFLKQNEKDIWVAPLIDIAKHIKDQQPSK